MNNTPVTLAMLAERLSVSTTTVSKALRGKPGIGPEMVERVRTLAQELRYQPNYAAKMLKVNTADTIGVLIAGDIVNPWYSQLVSRLEEAFFRVGMTMILSLGKGSLEREDKCLNNFKGGRVAGVVIGPVIRQRHFQPIRESLDRGMPLLAFNCVEELPISYVAIDQKAGAKLAVGHLLENGHRNIVYLGCPPLDRQESGRTRNDGFVEAMFDHNLPITRDSIVTGDTIRRFGYDGMKTILAGPASRRPTAIFCHNDDVAIGAMLAIQQAGLRIPDDISLIGFDDIAESTLCLPPLTTIGGVMDELAGELVETLRQLIADSSRPPIKKLITPRLIRRESVKNLNS